MIDSAASQTFSYTTTHTCGHQVTYVAESGSFMAQVAAAWSVKRVGELRGCPWCAWGPPLISPSNPPTEIRIPGNGWRPELLARRGGPE